MNDYRISVEEIEKEAEIMEMARNLINEACEGIQDSNPLTKETDVPFLNYFIQL